MRNLITIDITKEKEHLIEKKYRKHVEIIFNALEEFEDPSDHFEFEEDIKFASSGAEAAWFCAEIQVRLKDDPDVLGEDNLGGCSYRSFEDFINEKDGYCDDMVKIAFQNLEYKIRDLKATINKIES